MEFIVAWVLPIPLEAHLVFERIGKKWQCPWCKSEQVTGKRAKRVQTSTWVELAVRKSEPRWVCEGCAIEVFYACNAEDFENSEDYNKVKRIARQEGLELSRFRCQCIEQQLEVIASQSLADRGPLDERRAFAAIRAWLQRVLVQLDDRKHRDGS